MGLFGTLRRRQRERVDAARRDAESAAREQGASAQEITAAGDEAARAQRRRNVLRTGAGAGGFSGG